MAVSAWCASVQKQGYLSSSGESASSGRRRASATRARQVTTSRDDWDDQNATSSDTLILSVNGPPKALAGASVLGWEAFFLRDTGAVQYHRCSQNTSRPRGQDPWTYNNRQALKGFTRQSRARRDYKSFEKLLKRAGCSEAINN